MLGLTSDTSSAKLHSDPSLGFDVAKNFVVTRLAEAGASTAILDHLQTLPFMKPATSYTSVVGIWAHVDDIWLPVPMHPQYSLHNFRNSVLAQETFWLKVQTFCVELQTFCVELQVSSKLQRWQSMALTPMRSQVWLVLQAKRPLGRLLLQAHHVRVGDVTDLVP